MGDRKETFDSKMWTTKLFDNIYNPLYDWRTEDIWGAVAKLDLKFKNL